jgi:hypothetical protein
MLQVNDIVLSNPIPSYEDTIVIPEGQRYLVIDADNVQHGRQMVTVRNLDDGTLACVYAYRFTKAGFMPYGYIGSVNTYESYRRMKLDYGHSPLPYEVWVTWQTDCKEGEVFK